MPADPQFLLNTLTFPLRALTLFEADRWGLSSLATERFRYVGAQVRGRCLDIGCGRRNRFIREFVADPTSVGIDVFPYEGLQPDQIISDPRQLPFADTSFDTVTFIANINHIPRPWRPAELRAAYRVLKPGGRIIVTMGHPWAEWLVHQVVYWYDRCLGTNFDMDTERGMMAEEAYYLHDEEIEGRLYAAGFSALRKKYFWSQWGLNHLWVGEK